MRPFRGFYPPKRALLSKSQSNAAVCRETAVYRNNRSRNETACVIVRKPHQRTDKIGNLTKLLHGRSSQNLARSRRRRSVFVEQKASVLIGYKETRRNCITTNITRRKMHGQPLRKVGNTSFCRTVCRNFGKLLEAVRAE